MGKNFSIFVLFTLMEYIDSCAVLTNRPINEEMERNLKSPWMVLIMDKAKRSFLPGIGYGSIISENLVLTAAKAVSDHKIRNLVVLTDCEMNFLSEGTFSIESCVYRRVFLIYYENRALATTVKDNYWAVLYVDKPFELTKRINTIPLINDENIDDINEYECLVYHWVVMVYEQESAFVTMEYSIAPSEEGFKMFKYEEKRFSWDLDCILESCKLTASYDGEPGEMSFLGSPIACPLISDRTKYIQVGFSTMVYKIYSQEPLKYEHMNGTLHDLSSRQESLNKLVTRLTNLIEKRKKTKTTTE